MANECPRVSFGLAVRNGEQFIRRAIDSLLSQTFEDFDVVVSDNASTDGTSSICQEYANRDGRIRYFRNVEDLGQIVNVNRVFQLSRGEYFRWIGTDDWLEPGYAARCVEVLDSHSEAIAVTTYFTITDSGGNQVYRPFDGPFVEAATPHERFARMLWFFHAGDALWDPLYAMIRRETLERTALIRMIANADWLLAAELSLLGRFRNVPECLAHRNKNYEIFDNRAELLRRYHPTRFAEIESSTLRLVRILIPIVREARLTTPQNLHCFRAISGFAVKELRRRLRREFHGFSRRPFRSSRRRLRKILKP